MTRRNWSCWTISLAPPRPIPDHPEGLAESRSFVKCPICLEQINVASATAMKNRSLTGRNHLKKCPGQSPVCELVTAPTNTTTDDEVDAVLPPSKRPPRAPAPPMAQRQFFRRLSYRTARARGACAKPESVQLCPTSSTIDQSDCARRPAQSGRIGPNRTRAVR